MFLLKWVANFTYRICQYGYRRFICICNEVDWMGWGESVCALFSMFCLRELFLLWWCCMWGSWTRGCCIHICMENKISLPTGTIHDSQAEVGRFSVASLQILWCLVLLCVGPRWSHFPPTQSLTDPGGNWSCALTPTPPSQQVDLLSCLMSINYTRSGTNMCGRVRTTPDSNSYLFEELIWSEIIPFGCESRCRSSLWNSREVQLGSALQETEIIAAWEQHGTIVFKGNLLLFGVLGSLIISISALCYAASRRDTQQTAGLVCSEILHGVDRRTGSGLYLVMQDLCFPFLKMRLSQDYCKDLEP